MTKGIEDIVLGRERPSKGIERLGDVHWVRLVWLGWVRLGWVRLG